MALVLTLVPLCLPLSSQEQELIVPEYLAPQYTAPSNAPFTVVIAGTDEPGQRKGVFRVTRDIQMVQE